MRFPPQFLDELRARLPVSDVVGRRVKLKKQGREWRGLSPFNQEKTPSFYVNDQKGFFHDFSSGKHGDIFGFVMETEGIPFPEAVERLAALAGLPVPKPSAEVAAREERRKTLHEVMGLAAAFFETTLASRTGAKARGYLADRGLDPALQLRFRLGYAPPDRFALKEHLGAMNVPVEDMIETGLLVAGDDIPVPFDRFRDRVMFPIFDLRGRCIAFGGRALHKDAPAKYLNSPETPLFHKGATLYNGAMAREAAHRGETVIAVEGYIDVMALVGVGLEAAVAPLGTALTEDQLALLWRMADEPVLCFDGDAAGQRAAHRAVDLALPHLKPGKSLRFALLPQGRDPDDLVRSGGREAILEVLSAARPLAEMLWTREASAGTIDTPERRAALEARVAGLVGTIRDDVVKRHYRQDLEQRLRALFAPRRSEPAFSRPRGGSRGGGSFGERRFGAARGAAVAQGSLLTASPLIRGLHGALPPREALILLAVLNHPSLLETQAEALAELEFRHADADRLRRALLDATAHASGLAPESLRSDLVAAGLANVLGHIEKSVTHGSDWPARPGAAPQDVTRWWTHVITLHRKARTLNKELKEAETALGAEPTEENLQWMRDVQERLAALEGTEALIEGFGASSGRAVRGF